MAQFHRLTVSDIRVETEDCLSIVFDIPASLREVFAYVPGQYLTLRAEISGEEVRRSYSLCSALQDKEWRVAIKRVEGGIFSNFAHDTLSVGDTLDVMPPQGKFSVSPELERNGRHIHAFAAGSGITPILSIIKSILAVEDQTKITLFYGNQSIGTIIFRSVLEALKDRYTERFSVLHILSREAQEAPLLNGRIDADKAQALLKTLVPKPADLTLLCGPGPMIEALRGRLPMLGIAPELILFEHFAPTGVSKPAKSQKVTGVLKGTTQVTVRMDGVQTTFAMGEDAASVMEAAREAGLDAPFSCKGGVCATCRAQVLEGAVEMAQNFSLSEKDVAAGYILTCQAQPLTPSLVIDYDAV